ncbi:phosphate-induced protein 1 [Halteromyces radiatus]|uniref:phosphate-induced protein 1 n=1 Tax=Halteromyces radiatus TaxID=101107 RepID=UPI00221F3354|nr:phosphate-induced protein 1 [Halteromyces radiatus]KAI8086153.1 phosphate-induced protein 1 [Halteromyces radiatus]
MLLSSLGIFLFSLAGIVTCQQQTSTNNSSLNSIATQYGSTFKNAGGKVLTSFVNAYVIFYGDWSSSNATTDQKTFLGFLDDVSTTSWFSILKEYTDSNGGSVSGPLNLAAAVHDTGSAGLNLTDHNTHKTIILNAVQSGYLSANNQLDSNGIYILLLGPNVHDSEFCSTNCGYNSYSDQFQYIFIGYPGGCPQFCVPTMIQQQSPNNSPSIDAAITILSHELQDVLTDPRMDAWSIHSGNQVYEIGDFCSGASYNTSTEQWFGNLQTTSTGANYNLEFDNGKYLVQTIYSKEKNSCLLSK